MSKELNLNGLNKEEAKIKVVDFILKKLNFSQGDAGIPLYKESKNINGWVNFGQDNLMPLYYRGLLARSSKHAAIVNTKQRLIGGNGWNRDDKSIEALNFIKNPYGEYDLDEVVSRCSYDYEAMGAFALEVIWNKDRESIKCVNHIPVGKIRIANKDPERPYECNYFICDDWKKWASKPIVSIPGFSTINRKETNQLLYCKRYSEGTENYGEPIYMPAARWAELEYEISNFHLAAAKNGFTPGLHINIPFSMPNEDEIEREVNRLRQEFEGTDNGNAPFITFSDGDNKITITVIDKNSSDERFIQLNKEITEGIMTGHMVTSPTLFGVAQQGMMSNKDMTIADLQLFQTQYVTPVQNKIEKEFNRLASINGVERLSLNNYELDYDITMSISDMLAVLSAQIPDEQKKAVLVTAGYRLEEADRIIDAGSGQKPTTPNDPAV